MSSTTIYEYYVYAYINKSTGLPYYIGKGKGSRAYKPHLHISVPKDKSKIVFCETNMSEIGAFALERRLIRFWGKKFDNSGILLNIQDGGQGGSYIMPEETKVKLSKKLKQTNAVNDYWKKGVNAAAEKIRGTHQSDSHKSKRAKAKSREVEIEGVLYSSGKEAAEKLGYTAGAISSWVKKNGSRYNINIPSGSNQYKKR